MTKKNTQSQKRSKTSKRQTINANAAGIDISASAEHFVAVDPEKTENCVRCFGHFTQDLYDMADWLTQYGIETVALESTGVYWMPVCQVLESRGIEVCLVNSKHVSNVPGRKSDVMDCQWLQYLHSVGLLNASFRPSAEIGAIRSIRRHRDTMVQTASSYVQRMQKALDQMNLKLHYVISDITGETGMKIIESILAGERDPRALAKLKNNRIKASEEKIAKALLGDYLPEHLFTLKQNLEGYCHCRNLINECDSQLEGMPVEIDSKINPQEHPLPEKSKRKGSKEPNFKLREEMYRVFGVDLTRVDGIGILVVYTIFSEIGTNLSAFPSEAQFVSWLGLCPGNKQSSGRILSTRTRTVKNPVSKALRMAAQSMHHARSALGEYYRRMRAKLGAPKAITATAAKLARILYKMITTKTAYDETQFARNQASYQKRRLLNLKRQASELGFKLVGIEPDATVVS